MHRRREESKKFEIMTESKNLTKGKNIKQLFYLLKVSSYLNFFIFDPYFYTFPISLIETNKNYDQKLNKKSYEK